MPDMNATDKYRAKMRKAGFRYMCFWVHKDDVEKVRDVTEPKRIAYVLSEVQKLNDRLAKTGNTK
jgi:hypothetical protein